MRSPPPARSSLESDSRNEPTGGAVRPCMIAFNTNDPTGAGGTVADALTAASWGVHALPIATGALLRDTRDILSHAALDTASVLEQARLVAEDVAIQAIKVGFLGGAETIGAVAAFASDYPQVPLIAYLPDLSWWDDAAIDSYLQALGDLLLPEVAVLVGHDSTLRRWLRPESLLRRPASPTDLARAAAERGTPYVLATGMAASGQHVSNMLVSSSNVLLSRSYERLDADFLGAGDTLSAALTALLAGGHELTAAVGAALDYTDRTLEHGHQPGMGGALPDRLFWTAPLPAL